MSKVAVIFGGPAPEHDISILTGLQVGRELSQGGHDVTALYWSKVGDWFSGQPSLEGKDFLEGVPRSVEAVQLTLGAGAGFVPVKKGMFGKPGNLDVEVAVVCCHGAPGEDGSLQGALDLAGIPYTGPNVTAAALGMDKLAFTGVIQAAGLPALPRVLISETLRSVPFDGPYILKPRFGGSSIGIEVVDNLDTAKALLKSSPHFKAGALAEPYKPGSFDLNVSVRMYPEPQLSAIEKPIRSSGSNAKILDYADKYVGGQGMVSAPREIPANIPSELEERIREISFAVAELCGVRGVQRLDFLLDGDDLYVNEINTIPGSMSKYLWVDPPVPFRTLLEDMINEATARPSTHWTTAGADGSALRSAGLIAGKLS